MDAKTNEQLWELALNQPTEFIAALWQSKTDEDEVQDRFELSELEDLVYNDAFLPFKFELVEHYGGEGEGDTYYDVYKVTNNLYDDEIFIKLDAFYNSWEGVYWGDAEITRVYPKEVTRIEYIAEKPN